MATLTANKALEVRAWIERRKALDNEVKSADVMKYIVSRWPELNAEIQNEIYDKSL